MLLLGSIYPFGVQLNVVQNATGPARTSLLVRRTSENSVKAKFAEFLFHALRRISYGACACRNPLGSPESRAKQDQYREQFQSSHEHQDGESALGRCGQIGVELRGPDRARERARY